MGKSLDAQERCVRNADYISVSLLLLVQERLKQQRTRPQPCLILEASAQELVVWSSYIRLVVAASSYSTRARPSSGTPTPVWYTLLSYTAFVALIRPILCGNILLHDTPLQLLPLLLSPLLLLMQLEMLNILWMRKILLLDIITRVVLLPVVNLILVLVIAVVSRTHAEVRQFDILRVFGLKFGQADFAVLVDVEHVEDSLYDHLLLRFADVCRGGIGKTVCAADVGGSPDTGAVIVV